MLEALLLITALALGFGLILGLAAQWLRVQEDPLVERIDALLPQTQCAQCGFPGCRPYARAIAENRAEINQCPPGGDHTIRALAKLLDQEPQALNTAYGETKAPAVAFIHEADCIGCTLCIQACPVDAILGASRQMHTVIASECTGCELCVAPCPVDCIEMYPLPRPHWPLPLRDFT